MRTMRLGESNLQVPVIAVGCMRIKGLGTAEAERFVRTALEGGANFFDHADVYGDGECETIFAEAVHMSASVREKMILQSNAASGQGVMLTFPEDTFWKRWTEA